MKTIKTLLAHYSRKMVLPAAVAALAGMTLAAPQAKAATVTASDDDLILAFRINDGAGTGGTTDLEIDLGTASNLETEAAADGGTLTISPSSGLAVQDLRTIYGDGSTDTSWNTRTDLVWSVVGTDAGLSNDIWITEATGTKVPKSASASSQSGPAGKINTLYASLNDATSTANSSEAVAVPAGQGNSYTTEIRNGDPGTYSKDYNYFANSTENGVPSSGVETSELYYLPSGAAVNGTALGDFALSSNGTFTFTEAAAVPEPSVWASILMGAGLLVLWNRRKPVPR